MLIYRYSGEVYVSMHAVILMNTSSNYWNDIMSEGEGAKGW